MPSPDSAAAARRLAWSVDHLRLRAPALSAEQTLWPWQRLALVCAVLLLVLGVILDRDAAAAILLAVLALPFLLVTGLRLVALAGPVGSSGEDTALGATAVAGVDDDLATYAILVPLYREAAVVPSLLAALAALEYPADKLEILLVVEVDDRETRAAIASCGVAANVRVVVVPEGEPRTKPKALQYAVGLVRSSHVVVFDAEDQPEPDQLKRALACFTDSAAGADCVQARLNVDNWDERWLTRQFAIEYTALFDAILPALERLGLPVPLGGTSNHFRGILAQTHQKPKHVMSTFCSR